MKGVETVFPSPVVKSASSVREAGKMAADAQGSLRWMALTRTISVLPSIDPIGKRSLMRSAVSLLTQLLMVLRACSGAVAKSSWYTPVP